MSRGGRGRGGGGGGGGFGSRGGRGGGAGLGGPFGGDDLKPDYSVTELFPPQPPPVQSALSKEERAIVARYRSHREKIHNGPLYTVMAPRRGAGVEDPFNSVTRYSEKYKKKPRKTPKLDARPYVAEFFPEELYATLGIHGDEEKNANTGSENKKRLLLLSTLDALLDDTTGLGGEDYGEEGEGGDGSGKKKADDDDDDELPDGAEDEEMDEFTEDEEGDYNALQYDSGGDDISDMGDDDGGGEYM